MIFCLTSCNSSLSVFKLNKKFISKQKPLSEWDRDLLNKRNVAFQKLNLNLDSINTLFLIEEYDIASTCYDGILYIDENKFFHYYNEGLSKEVKIIERELTNTEKFIVTELKKGKLNNIKAKSLKTDVISPGSLYITVAKSNAIKQVRLFKFQEFYID